MQRITLALKAAKAEIAYGCFKAKEPLPFDDLVNYSKSLLDDKQWLIFLGKPSLVPARKVLATVASYTIYAYLQRRMISRWPEIEFLLYLFGTRNISEATRLAGAQKTESIGLVAISIGEDAGPLEKIVEKIKGKYSLESTPCTGWAEEFSEILGVNEKDPVRIAGIMRSRAAILSLSV